MMPPSSPQHVVIIGAGFGGLACARKLSKEGGTKVTLIDRKNHHLCQPLLSQVATSTLTVPNIATGARTSFFGNDHWAERVFQLKSLSDAFEIRTRVLRNLELVDRDPQLAKK